MCTIYYAFGVIHAQKYNMHAVQLIKEVCIYDTHNSPFLQVTEHTLCLSTCAHTHNMIIIYSTHPILTVQLHARINVMSNNTQHLQHYSKLVLDVALCYTCRGQTSPKANYS